MLKQKVKLQKKKLSNHYQEQLLIDDDYYKFLLVDFDQAKESIDISTYIFSNDRIGKKIIKKLEQAANRQVRIRLLLDGVGSRNCDATLIRDLNDKGIAVKIYHPLPWKVWQWGSAAYMPQRFLQRFFYLLMKMNSRNHRKLCIIDNKIAYVSSANIDESHLKVYKGGAGWHDITVRITGKQFNFLEKIFNRTWRKYSIKQKIKNKFRHEIKNQYFYPYMNRHMRRKSYKDLLDRINNAKYRIWIMNAYFVPDSYLLKALIKAAKRDIDIRIILPRTSDVMVSTLVANTFYVTLVKNNISVYEFLGSMLHAKAMMIDDWYRIGSSNLNTRSLKHDLELDVVLSTIPAQMQLEEQFLLDINQSEKLSMTDLKKQSFLKTLLGRLFLFLRHWL